MQTGESTSTEVGLKPVSYTHLDVYKRQTARCEPAGDHVKAGSKFFVQIVFQAAAPEEVLEQVGEAAEHDVRCYPSDSSIQFIAEVMRYHLRFSAASCARPARVSL